LINRMHQQLTDSLARCCGERQLPKSSILVSLLLLLLLSGCASKAHLVVEQQASRFGFQSRLVTGQPFQHKVYSRFGDSARSTLHVYIEGDGVPWRRRTVISSDPTSRFNMMLRLMNMDQAPTLYVGRPCYIGLAQSAPCNADHWTFSRYSEQVVDSMAKVIRSESAGFERLVLMGHSGGGALAMLLAERLPDVVAVVTVAGNLNVAGWVEHHEYTPLYGSLDPIDREPLPLEVAQLHLLGEKDRKIPPALVTKWIDSQLSATAWRFENYSHSCCWDLVWPRVLRWVRDKTRVATQA